MKRITKLVLAIIILFSSQMRAEEGMWLPMLVERLNYVDMQKMGLQLSASEIYSVNNSSLKDAIVQFGNGCTGELISSQGLLITNHHCGYGQIQSHSTVDNNILRDGFWAKSKKEELPNPGLTAKFLLRMEDVTARVKAELRDDMTELERARKIREVSAAIEKETVGNTHYVANVRSFYENNEFYLFVYEIFLDVRLVGNPPEAIGKFGADADNWMWPRHTGDFALFRIYMGKDGKPATYSEDNIPYVPKHYLPISLDGVKADDFAMIIGYPGRTDRYATSYSLKNAIEVKNPVFIDIRTKKLEVIQEYSKLDPAVRIQYAAKHASIANYWKYYIGQTKQIQRNNVIEKKMNMEKEFKAFAEKNPKYANVLPDFQSAYEIMRNYEVWNTYYSEAVRGIEAITLCQRVLLSALNAELAKDKPDEAKIKAETDRLKASADGFFKNYYQPLDQKMAEEMFRMYSQNVPKEQQPEEFVKMVEKNKGDFAKMAKNMFEKTVFADKEAYLGFLDNPSLKVLKKDMVYQYTTMLLNPPKGMIEDYTKARDMISRSNRLYVEGLRLMDPEKKWPANANSTMRITYGKVLDYNPADAIHYDFKTTLTGVMEKEDPNSLDFIVPEKLKDLYQKKDFGIYAEDGNIVTCFLSTTDITGGNSGSPVINAKGELIGLAFDGNWEAMSGDIFYEPSLQRTINVDIRYVLFVIDKYAGAKNLIEEMTLKAE